MHLKSSEQGRFSYDGLKRQRLTQPMARGDGGKLTKVDWQDALTVASDAIAEAGENIAVVVGPFADVETMCLAKDLANKAGSEMVTTEQSFIANGDLRADYTFNSTIAGIEEADRVIIIG
jgi:NADH dehydrogenase (ubiquinone) Fe-S protein 1